jgi:hypothetical protein
VGGAVNLLARAKSNRNEGENVSRALIALIASTATLGALTTSAASAEPALVFNYGQCISEGFPGPGEGVFGPLNVVINKNGTGFHVPPGQQQNAPGGSIGCEVSHEAK